MNKEDLTQLVKIYNTLTLVSTKGEDTVTMGQCLVAFQEVIEKISKDFQDKEE